MTSLYFMGLFFFFLCGFLGWYDFVVVEVVNLISIVVVCCGLRLVMGFESGCGACWWTGERERERQIWTWQTQFWVFWSKPGLGSLEANLVLRLFMLLMFPTVHSFGLLEKPSYVGGSLLWCAYDYIASCWTVLEVSAFLKFLSNFLPFLHNDIFWSCFLLILYEFFVLGGERHKRKAKIHIYPQF